jgi:hypothetical protein
MPAPDYAFRVERVDDGRTYLLSGVIDENADLTFFHGIHGAAKVMLGNVRRINSFGVRQWIEAIRRIPADAHVEFHECPPPVVDQINMVAGFMGKGNVISFYAPMICEKCAAEQDALFTVADCQENGGHLPAYPCPKCGTRMEVDDLEEHYLLFVR